MQPRLLRVEALLINAYLKQLRTKLHLHGIKIILEMFNIFYHYKFG